MGSECSVILKEFRKFPLGLMIILQYRSLESSGCQKRLYLPWYYSKTRPAREENNYIISSECWSNCSVYRRESNHTWQNLSQAVTHLVGLFSSQRGLLCLTVVCAWGPFIYLKPGYCHWNCYIPISPLTKRGMQISGHHWVIVIVVILWFFPSEHF